MWTFNPIYKCTLWGAGNIPKLKKDPSPDSPSSPIGESWEISGIEGNESVVNDGPDSGCSLSQLIERYGADLLGKENMRRFGKEFPLLIKLIDTADNLSVQVHPDDEMAQRLGHPFGKNEMWVVLDSKPGANIANGLRHSVNPAALRSLVESGQIVDALHFSPVKPGNAFFIPAGRVHAIGKGILIAEIQQSSNDTFRLFDYNRTDANGNPRQLHIDRAAEALNYNDTHPASINYSLPEQGTSSILESSFFSVNTMRFSSTALRSYSALDSFVILMGTGGEAIIDDGVRKCRLSPCHSLLLPATCSGISISPVGKSAFNALEIYINNSDL